MSLFASAFETGITAGPSTVSTTKSSHKRKRPSHGGSTGVDGADQLRAAQKNLEKLMKTVEGGSSDKKERRDSSTLRTKPRSHEAGHARAEEVSVGSGSPAIKKRKGDLKQNEQSTVRKHAQIQSPSSTKADSGVKADKKKKQKQKQKEIPLPPIPASKEDDSAGLTSLQKGMKSKLEGARFRWINEQLYSTSSTDAVAMMKKDPKIFADYHQSHRVQTAAWPSPPLPYIIERITALPAGTVIADLGCGDAGLARALVPTGKVVLSYDLVSDQGVPGSEDAASTLRGEGWVVQADFLTHIPLPGRPGGDAVSTSEPTEGKKKSKSKARSKETGSEIVDVVVCCLSLMGTNWVGGIYEACRVLKQGGTLHVAEVTSRFVSTDAFVEKVVSFGFELQTEESPSTHFTLYNFTKTTAVPLAPVRGQKGWEQRVKEGEGILQACVYKKR